MYVLNFNVDNLLAIYINNLANSRQEIWWLVTHYIGHYMIIVFNIWSFCDQKHLALVESH
jgi:hypothetical protein